MFIRQYQGEFRLPDPTGDQINLGWALDILQFEMVPFERLPDGSHWPFQEYLLDLLRNPYVYFYNEIFLSSIYFKDEYVKLSEQRKSPLLNLSENLPHNGVFLNERTQGILANLWIIEAEWEQITVKEKPDYIKGITPNPFIFDHYDIFILRKVLSAAPVSTSQNEVDIRNIEFRNDVYSPNL